jgi:hypothetical protein
VNLGSSPIREIVLVPSHSGVQLCQILGEDEITSERRIGAEKSRLGRLTLHHCVRFVGGATPLDTRPPPNGRWALARDPCHGMCMLGSPAPTALIWNVGAGGTNSKMLLRFCWCRITEGIYGDPWPHVICGQRVFIFISDESTQSPKCMLTFVIC